jgi:hypothetical protein
VCNTDTDCSDFPFDPRFQPYVHVTGAATNCEKLQGTFDLDVQQYISMTKANQNNKIIVPISCYIPDSPRWKTSKPVPYNNRYTSITGLLTDVSLNTETTCSEEKQPIECFHITVDNVIFTGTRGAITGNATSPNVLDKGLSSLNHPSLWHILLITTIYSNCPHSSLGKTFDELRKSTATCSLCKSFPCFRNKPSHISIHFSLFSHSRKCGCWSEYFNSTRQCD